MKKIKKTAINSVNLRKKAEELVNNNSSNNAEQYSEVETKRLIHELEVHQIELELMY